MAVRSDRQFRGMRSLVRGVDIDAMTAHNSSWGPWLASDVDRASTRRVLTRFLQMLVVFGLVAFAIPRAGAAAAPPSGVAMNEINCTGADWVELINTSATEASLAGW